MTSRTRAPKREILGWAMFDFANQAYTLLIITVVFGDLFTRIIVGDAPDYRLGNLLWSVSLAISYLMVVITAPVLGAIADHRARRKQFLFVTYLLCIVATALLWFVEPGLVLLGMVLLVVSNYAYASGEALIASFLPNLGPPEDLGRISGFGWSLGYVGGLASAVFVLLVLGETSVENFDSIRWVGPWAAVFFMVAAIPTFVWVREPPAAASATPVGGHLRAGIARVRGTLGHLERHPDLAVLLLSVFFAMSGIYIIITYAFIYGAQVIRWDESVRALMFIIVQITAAVGAVGFGFLQDRIGAARTYRITLVLWMLTIVLIWATPLVVDLMALRLGVVWEAQYLFLVVGCAAGLSLGSSQSATRTLVGLFAPEARSAEFFGFWGLSMRLAGVFGLLAIGALQALLGLHMAILFCVALFAVAWWIAARVDEQRGRSAAGEGVPASLPMTAG